MSARLRRAVKAAADLALIHAEQLRLAHATAVEISRTLARANADADGEELQEALTGIGSNRPIANPATSVSESAPAEKTLTDGKKPSRRRARGLK